MWLAHAPWILQPARRTPRRPTGQGDGPGARLRCHRAAGASRSSHACSCCTARLPPGAGSYGHQDLCGNVSEWVSDWYGADCYTLSPGIDPGGPATGQQRIRRGGDFDHDGCTVWDRHLFTDGGADRAAGVRCAYDAS